MLEFSLKLYVWLCEVYLIIFISNERINSFHNLINFLILYVIKRSYTSFWIEIRDCVLVVLRA